jgi:vancomycin resistance protein YoaR
VVDSIGGGACQVTTTLYNAVLLAELEIVERAAHSMTISYADLGRDAAIAGTWKDLKFKNDKDVPVLVEVYTSGRTITFNIWEKKQEIH